MNTIVSDQCVKSKPTRRYWVAVTSLIALKTSGPYRAAGSVRYNIHSTRPVPNCVTPVSLRRHPYLFEISALTELLRGGVVGLRQSYYYIISVLHLLPLVNNNFRWWHIICIEPFWKSTKVAPQLKYRITTSRRLAIRLAIERRRVARLFQFLNNVLVSTCMCPLKGRST